jgi:hypothetical protein
MMADIPWMLGISRWLFPGTRGRVARLGPLDQTGWGSLGCQLKLHERRFGISWGTMQQLQPCDCRDQKSPNFPGGHSTTPKRSAIQPECDYAQVSRTTSAPPSSKHHRRVTRTPLTNPGGLEVCVSAFPPSKTSRTTANRAAEADSGDYFSSRRSSCDTSLRWLEKSASASS